MKQNYVLFVDDEIELHSLVKQKFKNELRSNMFELECFENGKHCFEFVDNNAEKINFLIIVTDLNMPVMNGFELLHKIKEKYPHIPVTISSAYGDRGTIEKAKSMGARDFYEKPIDFNVLRTGILELLEQAQASN